MSFRVDFNNLIDSEIKNLIASNLNKHNQTIKLFSILKVFHEFEIENYFIVKINNSTEFITKNLKDAVEYYKKQLGE